MKRIAILLPFKERFTEDSAGAASIWVKDYINRSKLKKNTVIFGNLKKKEKPLTSNFKNIELDGSYFNKNLQYTKKFYGFCFNV